MTAHLPIKAEPLIESSAFGHTTITMPDGVYTVRRDRWNDAWEICGPDGFYRDGFRDDQAAIDALLREEPR